MGSSAFISRIGSDLTSRGLGAGSAPTGNFVEVVIKITNAVYQEELYYPTTGVYAPEEIDGWYWDRTHSQGYADTPRHEIKDYIGGYKYNLQEGIPESYYQGAVLDGCELIDVKGSEKWKPVISTGMYCINGIDKQLYSNASICKIVSSGLLDLTGYGKDDITVAIYRRDGDYVKQKYREYKEDSIYYKYSIDGNEQLTIPSNASLTVGNKEAVLTDTKDAFESVGYKTSPTQSFYTEYFPIKDVVVRYKKDDGYLVVDAEGYTVDTDLGVIKLTSDFSSEIFVAYTAVPRVDIELDPKVGFSSELDLKSHNWKQSNGIIEITSEDKHVAKVELKEVVPLPSGSSLNYGTQSLRLKAQALDSKNNPVDEVLITIKSNAEQYQEVRFEGNLLVTSGETNSDGSVFTRINAPLNDESSSFFVEGKYNENSGLLLPENLVGDPTDGAVLENSLIFEVLKVDPFQGSGGLTLDVAWDENEQAFIIADDFKFESEDYKMFRNALKNTQVRSETGSGCFTVFYNSGFAEYDKVLPFGLKPLQKKVPIKNITDSHIYVHSEEDFTSVDKVKLFKKNENYEGYGLERLLYKKVDGSDPTTYEPISADYYNGGRLYMSNTVGNPANSDRPGEEIVSGYRVFLPRKEELVAECIDPASGLVIKSAPLKISLQLSDIYKSVLNLEDVGVPEVRLGVASHLSYDPVGNNIYFEADDS